MVLKDEVEGCEIIDGNFQYVSVSISMSLVHQFTLEFDEIMSL